MAVEKSDGGEATSKNVAVIFGVTGLVGKELMKKLLSKSNWEVYGVARRSQINPTTTNNPNYHFIPCDLLNQPETHQKLTSMLPAHVSHVFWVTWASQFPLESQDCCDQNKFMMSNALNSILPRAHNSLRHFSLQTGTKHYVSLRDLKALHQVHYHEDWPRAIAGCNFYYALEDLLREKLAGSKVAWAVHRPGFIVGSSPRTLYNFMGSLCVYGTLCKELGLPFLFGGTKECWENMYIDCSDAGLVADQHIWAATDEKIYSYSGQAFNAINGSSFTWKQIWPAIGLKLGVKVEENSCLFEEGFIFSSCLGDKKVVWRKIVERENLVETEMEELANWGFLDALFRCPVKMLGSREKADRLGFTARCDTLDSILHWIDIMRNDRLIP